MADFLSVMRQIKEMSLNVKTVFFDLNMADIGFFIHFML
jgi:hypothetical protein